MVAIITEIRYRNGPGFDPDSDYVEVRVPTGTDVSDIQVDIYNPNGSLRSSNTLDNPPTTVGGFDYYIVTARINRFGAVSLVEDGTISSFVSFDDTVTINAGTPDELTSTIIGTNGNDSTASLSSTDGENFFVDDNPNPGAPACFTSGTLIETPNGVIPVERLRPGDMVTTSDHDAQAIRLCLSRKIGHSELLIHENLRPVRIMAGTLGQGLPKQDLLVSRQHRMQIVSKVAQRMFGTSEVLIPAIRLTELPGIFVDCDIKEVEYFHLVFEQHQIVFAEGSATESFYLGPEAFKTLSNEALAELTTIFPDLHNAERGHQPARFIPTGKQQKKLITRCLKNGNLHSTLPPHQRSD
ncbi:hypothetical protein ROA7450_02536 [Roseovarius albus]|uniref:Hedgehog/Intein (Hint) domain-containing protein n=1 Tax=Roseovarius albus TaxID=1247867 RepID=A0A1X6ZGU9_9RHOB|nr:Hint domain-containing protein [Roseovarius albus]SLN50876.1 hypothetical protein ROA7450_02536 [Roseovarius albus]